MHVPVVEAASWLEWGSASRVSVPAAMCGPVIMAEVAVPIPLLCALAVGGGSGGHLHRRVHVIEPVGERRGGASAVKLTVVVE